MLVAPSHIAAEANTPHPTAARIPGAVKSWHTRFCMQMMNCRGSIAHDFFVLGATAFPNPSRVQALAPCLVAWGEIWLRTRIFR